MSRRDLSRHSDRQHTKFSGIDAFLISKVPAGVLTIDYNGSPLDILNQPAGSDTTIVVFHTAMSPNMRTIPVFSGGGVTAGLNVNTIMVSDPTLEFDDALNLAWFAGNKSQPLQRDLPSVLAHILEEQGAKNVVFFGASGGGFAALYYSAYFPGSLAIPVNPQIIIKDYQDEAVQAYAAAAFGASDLSGARDAVTNLITGDLRHLYRGGHLNTVAYVQNTMDTHHLYRHMAHFMNAIPTSKNMNVLAADWGRGHVPPPKETTASMLEAVVASAPRWGDALQRLGFVQEPAADYAIVVRESAA
ncbi:hypothetical protein [Paenarthrobacter ureafaciens]|uniref:hypothetical protein n=1 Tax=Paenarthrobacter ureafaciens TaxID=37931 RepID=UPI00111A01C4|nr:hypothetical protein [Paenarthrobacter ureafaciens]GLU58559.1 hypothetical protein Pure01_10720 [Paenarthrobacter ureafaciens]GLU61804.1 hypothetical protein Pure02_00540 [Paenarthrobacter ureafaciens]GLU66078.1 hypothetical protein Pure03_00540 [Paenarthrobacter ureafaciens]GLU71598.1 hypothetical protein Pure04_13130 [Paenarthrobacter ureafaciens]GLU74615.1 hypothetical protein Pure05_00550 [Paenarthrobacter ureafaciens]